MKMRAYPFLAAAWLLLAPCAHAAEETIAPPTADCRQQAKERLALYDRPDVEPMLERERINALNALYDECMREHGFQPTIDNVNIYRTGCYTPPHCPAPGAPPLGESATTATATAPGQPSYPVSVYVINQPNGNIKIPQPGSAEAQAAQVYPPSDNAATTTETKSQPAGNAPAADKTITINNTPSKAESQENKTLPAQSTTPPAAAATPAAPATGTTSQPSVAFTPRGPVPIPQAKPATPGSQQDVQPPAPIIHSSSAHQATAAPVNPVAVSTPPDLKAPETPPPAATPSSVNITNSAQRPPSSPASAGVIFTPQGPAPMAKPPIATAATPAAPPVTVNNYPQTHYTAPAAPNQPSPRPATTAASPAVQQPASVNVTNSTPRTATQASSPAISPSIQFSPQGPVPAPRAATGITPQQQAPAITANTPPQVRRVPQENAQAAAAQAAPATTATAPNPAITINTYPEIKSPPQAITAAPKTAAAAPPQPAAPPVVNITNNIPPAPAPVVTHTTTPAAPAPAPHTTSAPSNAQSNAQSAANAAANATGQLPQPATTPLHQPVPGTAQQQPIINNTPVYVNQPAPSPVHIAGTPSSVHVNSRPTSHTGTAATRASRRHHATHTGHTHRKTASHKHTKKKTTAKTKTPVPKPKGDAQQLENILAE